MGLAPGTKLGPYEIAEPLGAGGMGEVYRALDSRLDRAVAIKVLATHLSTDPELRQRFDREARAISSLQHPNICTLHDVGHQNGIDFLVMELLEGETLADRLKRGPLPVEQAVRIAIDIADALEKAHRQGIVHRDLKPGNVMVSKSGTKLMDFGLAKPATAMAAVASARGSAVTPTTPTSPTIAALAAPTSPITGRGMVVGTFQYIAPEVLQGGEATPRSDIFALGAVLYEMLTGQRAFDGKSQLSVASAILEREPAPVSSIQPMTPPALEQVVKICLAKDPEERFQTAHDLKLQLKWIAEASTSQLAAPAQVRARRALQKRTLMIAAVVGWVAAVTALAFFLSSRAQLDQARRPVTAAWLPSESTEFAPVLFGAPALSPDGSKLLFLTGNMSQSKLWLRDVNSGAVRAVEGAEQPSFPFWSADGKYIGFFSGGKLKKVALAGGPVQVICDAAEGRGASWNQNGVIIFTPNIRESLYKVAEGGGTPEKITEAPKNWTHRNPYFLPDGDHYLFIAREASSITGPAGALWGASLSGEKPRQILERASNVQYSEGYLLYLRETVLVAQRFDPKSLTFSGDPIPIAEKLDTWNARDLVAFTAAHGTLVYRHGAQQKSQLVLVDRDGRELERLGEPALYDYDTLRTSRDGSLIGVARMDPDTGRGDVWTVDTGRNTMSRSTFADAGTINFDFSPDARRIAVSTIAGSVAGGLWIQPTSGSGTQEKLEAPTTWGAINSWAPNGRYLFFMVQNNATRADVYYIDLEGDKKLTPFIQTPANEGQAELSPNGKWLAYLSDESGRYEVYVTAFPGPGGKWQISNGGGGPPAWSVDGKQLYYINGDKLMSVPIRNLEDFQFGTPAALPLHVNEFASLGPPGPGERFPALKPLSGGQSHPQEVIFNWTGTLKK